MSPVISTKRPSKPKKICLFGKIIREMLMKKKIHSINFYHDSLNWWDHSKC